MACDFWDVVAQVKQQAGDDIHMRPVLLNELLLTLSAEQVLQLYHEYHGALLQAHCWEVWAAVYLLNGGCSEEDFAGFCDFLISEGKQVFAQVLQNPDCLADKPGYQYMDLSEYRDGLIEAYEELSGQDMPEASIPFPTSLEGEPQDEAKLAEILPRLVAKYPYVDELYVSTNHIDHASGV